MDRKKKLKMVSLIAGLMVVFAVITVVTVRTTPAGDQASGEGGQKVMKTVADRDEAEKLVGETVTRDDVEKALGKWDDFQMSSEGCERGTYAGRFFYKNFNIFSKTYDKGKTFYILQIN